MYAIGADAGVPIVAFPPVQSIRGGALKKCSVHLAIRFGALRRCAATEREIARAPGLAPPNRWQHVVEVFDSVTDRHMIYSGGRFARSVG